MINQGDLICKYNYTNIDLDIIKSIGVKVRDIKKSSINKKSNKKNKEQFYESIYT